MEVQLRDTESLNRISTRWTPDDAHYKEAEQVWIAQLQSSLVAAIHDTSVRRKFLLYVKAKYSG